MSTYGEIMAIEEQLAEQLEALPAGDVVLGIQ